MAELIHYHTDCYFFAGCEHMLVNFWSSPALRSQFQVSFSYRHSSRYAMGLNQRARLDFPVYPMRFPDLGDLARLPARWSLPAKRGVLFSLRLALTVPLLCYEVWALRRLFVRVQPAIVHINNGGYPAALSARAAAIAARLASVPRVVMVVQNLAADYSRPPRWLDYPWDRLVARSVSMFVTCSAATTRRLRAVLRLEEGRCLPLPNGIALRQTTETREETRKRLGLETFEGVIFGVVGVLRPNKGHRVLLEAIIRILEAPPHGFPNIKILIKGDGPLRADLQTFVAENRLTGHCVFEGEDERVMDFMAILDVLVLPSIDHEDFPNVILEAMGVGKPVIASRLAGTPDQVIDGETGLLVAPRDVDQLASAVSRLALDEQLRARMGRAGRQRFQQYFMAETAVKRYIALYQSLIETKIS